MKYLLFILIICLNFGCKKRNSNAADEIYNYTWPLKSATVTPALTVNGKTSTNFMTINGNDACLNNNYALNFSADGSYGFSSTGALCDMISFKNAKYTKSGSEISLNDGFGHMRTVQINGDTIVDKYTFDKDNVTYTVNYIFTAKSK